jgi:O-antigen ligase
MGARSYPTDGSPTILTPSPSRSLAGRIVDRQGSIELEIVLAVAADLLWLVGGMAASRPFETMAHLAIIGLLLIAPRAGLLALIPLLPFQPGAIFGPHGPIVADVVALAISITLRAAAGQVSVPAIARPAVWLAVALLAMTIFQATLVLPVFPGGIPLSVLGELDQVLIIVIVFVGSVVFLRPDGVVPAMTAYLVSLAIVSAVAILHFARPGILRRLDLFWMVGPDATRFRATGVIPNANFLGLFVAIGLAWLVVIVAWYIRSGRLVPVVTGLAAGSIATVTLALTLSRAAIVAAAVGIVAVTARRSLRAAVAMLVAGVLVAVIAYPLFLNVRLGQTFGSTGEAGQEAQAQSDSLRTTQAAAAIKAFLDAPVLGHGFGTFSALSPRYTGQNVLTSAHNSYLKLAAEQGVAGLGLFIAFLVAIALALWRAPIGPWSAGLAVLGVIAVFSLTGDSLSSAQAIASGFMVIAGMLVAADAGRDPLGSARSDALRPSPEAG